MRIVIVTPGFAANETDSDCIPPLQGFVRMLAAEGHELHVLALDYPFHAKPYTFFGAQVYPCNGGNHWYTQYRTFSRAGRYLERIFLEYGKADVVHGFWHGMASLIAEDYAKKLEVPAICTLMGQEVVHHSEAIKRKSKAEWANMVCLSDWHHDRLFELTQLRESPIIPWGISPQDVPEQLSPETRPIDIIGVGSLIPVKNWPFWLLVVALIAREQPHLKAVLIGKGKLMKKLKAVAKVLKIEQHVEFTGGLTRPEVLSRMRNAKVLLHSSNFESFGYVLAEAAAQGCHVVSSNVGIAPQIGECADSVETLVLRVKWALERPPLKKPDVPYSMEATVEAYERLYEEKIGKMMNDE